MSKSISQAAIDVVDMFDQTNTNKAVERLGSRGEILKEYIEKLRETVNKRGQRTILSKKQVDS
jgi:hypothetical protein